MELVELATLTGPRHPVELVEPVELANLIVPGTPCVTGGTSETYQSHSSLVLGGEF